MLSAAPSQEIPPTVIRVEDLWCGYPGRPVLEAVNLEVARGEFIGVLGPNGSGKTTLVTALSGLLPIQKGHIEVLGSPLEDLKIVERARRIAVVGQNSEVRFPFSCEEVVRMGRYPHRKRWEMETERDAARVEWALSITDAAVLRERLVTAVSGGERQRVMVARALAQETPILLLDEATSAMDVHRKLEIFRILEELSASEQLTVLTVLHDVNLAALFCRRLVFLKDGKVVARGTPEEVLTKEILEEVYRTKVSIHEVEAAGRKRQVVFLP